MAQQNCKVRGSHSNVAENSSLLVCDTVWCADCDILNWCDAFTFKIKHS